MTPVIEGYASIYGFSVAWWGQYRIYRDVSNTIAFSPERGSWDARWTAAQP